MLFAIFDFCERKLMKNFFLRIFSFKIRKKRIWKGKKFSFLREIWFVFGKSKCKIEGLRILLKLKFQMAIKSHIFDSLSIILSPLNQQNNFLLQVFPTTVNHYLNFNKNLHKIKSNKLFTISFTH